MQRHILGSAPRLFSILAVAAVASGLFGAREASAQPVDLQHYQPATTLQGFGSVEGGAASEGGVPTLGVTAIYLKDPLVLRDAETGDELVVVSDRLDLVATASYGLDVSKLPLIQGLDVGLALPFVPWQKQNVDLTDPTLSPSTSSTTGLGDPRLLARVMLLSRDWALVDLSFIPVVSLPLATGGGYLGSKSVVFAPEVAASTKLGPFFAAANLGYKLRGNKSLGKNDSVRSLEIADQLSWRAAFAIDMGEAGGKEGLDIGVEAFGITKAARPFGNVRQTPFEAALLARYRVGDVVLQAGAGTGLTQGYGSPKVRVLASLLYAPVEDDDDHDGVRNKSDACPDVPEDRDGFEDRDGCPDPDNDKDGIADAADKCPDVAEDVDGFEDEDGCPDPDNDQDGIADGEDKCPDVAEDKNGYQDADGCPDADADRDGDGVADAIDKCPDEPEDQDGFEDADGCPDVDNDADGIPDATDQCPMEAEDQDGVVDDDGCPDEDNDGDGLLDTVDKCPNEPETLNGVDDEDGCPDKGAELVSLTKERIEIKDKVYFDTGSATIQARSFPLLDQVAALLKNHAEVKRIRIEGHTDSQGAADYNRTLSQARADAVRTYLIGKGIVETRLEAVGYGEDKPVASNSSSRGREANRRVEFNIVAEPPPAPAPESAAPSEPAQEAPASESAEPPAK